MPRFAADGCELHYEAHGDGPAVVLLHGFTSRGASWLRHGWVDALVEAGHRAVALDLPGHGESGPAVDAATPRLAANVVALLDELTLNDAAVVGFSFGGGVALQVATEAPERVNALVVGGVGDPALHPAEMVLDEPMRRNAELAGTDLNALRPYLELGSWPGSPTRVAPLPMPVLVIVAEADEYMWPAEELLERLQPSEVLRLPDRSHHQVVPNDDVKRAVVEFLATVRG